MEISVLISVFNGENFISDTIQSVLNQTFDEFEIIIIDDGSTDSTKTVIDSFKDDRIKYHFQENKGLSVALNTGIKLASGKYIARLDADDISDPNRLQIQYSFMELNPSYVLCGSYADVIDNDGNFIYTFRVPTSNDEIQKKMRQTNCIIHSASFYKRETALQVGGYYEPIRQYFEDYMFFTSMIKCGKFYNIDKPLITYRININSITTRDKNKKYDQLVKNVIQRGYITSDEKEFLFNYKSKVSKNKIKSSNYYLLLSRLVYSHQHDYKLSKNYLIKGIKSEPLNFNIIFTLFWFVRKYLINFIHVRDNI